MQNNSNLKKNLKDLQNLLNNNKKNNNLLKKLIKWKDKINKKIL